MIRQLGSVRRDGSNKVFSMYLNTDPSDPEQQGGKWRLQLKNGMRNFEEYLQQDRDKEELRNFQQVKRQVEKFMGEHEQHLQRGVILFATADEEVWYADCIQVRVKTEFYWKETAELAQLENILHDYPKAGIILVQKNEIKVIEANLNRVENTWQFEFDLDKENWHVKQSTTKVGQAASAKQKAGTKKDNFEAKFKANLQRWYKSIAPKLDRLAKDNEWEKTYIMGEKDISSELKNQMHHNVEAIIHKNVLELDESRVLQEVFG